MVEQVQWMWIRYSNSVWEIYNWRKIPLPWQHPRFRVLSLKFIDNDEFRRKIYLCSSSRGVRLEEDTCSVKITKLFEAVEICKISWWTFSIIFVSLRVERFRNLFIAHDIPGDRITECVNTIMRLLADESRWISETGREFRTSNWDSAMKGRKLLTALFFTWFSFWISLMIIVAYLFNYTKMFPVITK